MKFVINGWRPKSFFRHHRQVDADGIRELGKPAALLRKPSKCQEHASLHCQLRQQKTVLIRRRLLLLADPLQTRSAPECRIGTNVCEWLKISQE
jgi:hypothetical protein